MNLYQLKNAYHRLRGIGQEVKLAGKIGLVGTLRARKGRWRRREDGLIVHEDMEPLGILSRRVVTTVGVEFLTDAFQGLASLSSFSWHASGTGTTAESTGDTALGTEVESRVDGSQTENGSNVYRTVATINYTSSFTITEHGIFSASTGGTLWDRSVFSGISVVSGDAIEFTYDCTTNAGG